MNNVLKFLLVPLVMIAFVAVSSDFADAKRFGGGRSFGGSRSYQKSYSKPVSPNRQQATQSGSGLNQKRSKFGGLGGVLGGLLAGSLLGSLFFGHSFAGGGFMDLLLIAGIAFLAFKFFKGRRRGAQYAQQGAGMSYGGAGPDPNGAGYGTSRMADQAQAGWSSLGAQQAAPQQPEINVPEGFDENEFLEGAKLAFNRLQAAWDARDMDDIAQFTSPAVLDEIRGQAAQDPSPSKTEVLMLNVRLLEVRQEAGDIIATTFFDAFIRESPATGSEQVREVWHFKRSSADTSSMWRLDGIQQLDS